MASKKGTGKKDGKTRGQPEGGGDGTTGCPDEAVREQWKEFMDRFGADMERVLGSRSEEYRRMQESWLRVTEQLSRSMGGRPGHEGEGTPSWWQLYDTWMSGAREMQRQFEAVLDRDDPDHARLYESWSRQSGIFSDKLGEQMLRAMREQYELYDMWVDAFSMNPGDHRTSGDLGGILGRHYREFSEQVGRIAREESTTTPSGPKEGSEPTLQDLPYFRMAGRVQDAWLNTTSAMMKEVMASDAFGNNMKRSMDAQLKAREAMDKAMEDELKRMRLPTRSQLDDLYLGLTELDRKVSGLQDKLDELTAGNPSAKSAATRATKSRSPPKKKTTGRAKGKGGSAKKSASKKKGARKGGS